MNFNRLLIAISVLVLVISISIAFTQKKSQIDLIQPGAKLEKLADGFLFTEGPSADSKGNISINCLMVRMIFGLTKMEEYTSLILSG